MVRDLMARDVNSEHNPYISTPLSVRRGVRDTPLAIHHYATPNLVRRGARQSDNTCSPSSPVSTWSSSSHVEVRQRLNSSNRQAIALSLRSSTVSSVSVEESVQRSERMPSYVHNEVLNEVPSYVHNEVHNEVRSEVHSEVRSEVRRESRSEMRRESRSEMRRESPRSEARSGGGKRVQLCKETSAGGLVVRTADEVLKSPARRRKVCLTHVLSSAESGFSSQHLY